MIKGKSISLKNLMNGEINPTFKLGAEWCIEHLPATDEVMCKLCNQTFKKNDPQLKIKKKRHELGRHTRHKTKDERYPKDEAKDFHALGGLNFNKVEWIEG